MDSRRDADGVWTRRQAARSRERSSAKDGNPGVNLSAESGDGEASDAQQAEGDDVLDDARQRRTAVAPDGQAERVRGGGQCWSLGVRVQG
jgi:hypothetical protein